MHAASFDYGCCTGVRERVLRSGMTDTRNTICRRCRSGNQGPLNIVSMTTTSKSDTSVHSLMY
jgi:hypothetical protein